MAVYGGLTEHNLTLQLELWYITVLRLILHLLWLDTRCEPGTNTSGDTKSFGCFCSVLLLPVLESQKSIVKETVADEKLINQACSRRGAFFQQNKNHYLSLDQTAAEIAPVLHLITLFNPKCCAPLIPPLFSLFGRTSSRQTEGQMSFFSAVLQRQQPN